MRRSTSLPVASFAMSSPLYLANSHSKAYSVQTLSEATDFVQDLKLGHYIKIPPRATFLGVFFKSFSGLELLFMLYIGSRPSRAVQLISTILASFVQVGVKQWIFANVPDICQPDQKSQLTCPHNQVFYTASAVWWVSSSMWDTAAHKVGYSFPSLVYTPCFAVLACFSTSHYRGLIGPHSPIRHWINIPPPPIRSDRRALPPNTFLVISTEIS